MSAKILITGGNGFVGQHLIKVLLNQGFKIRASCRGVVPKLKHPNLEWIVQQLSANSDWRQALVGISYVVHCAARVHVLQEQDPMAAVAQQYHEVNVLATARLAAQAATAKVQRFIFLSTVKVHGEFTLAGHPFTEQDTPMPQDLYAASKWAAEQQVALAANTSGMQWTVLRLPLIYGPGVRGNFQRLQQWVHRGWPLPLGQRQNLRSMLAIPNLCDVIAHCLVHPKAANQVFLVSDDLDLCVSQLLQLLAAKRGGIYIFAAPTWLLNLAARVVGKRPQINRLLQSLQVSSTKVQTVLQWPPPISPLDYIPTLS
jgi:nucleoside-diphosphate-sugar epimerase